MRKQSPRFWGSQRQGKGDVCEEHGVSRYPHVLLVVLMVFQQKYKQVVGFMNNEGWVTGVDWIADSTESTTAWKEPDSKGNESGIELIEDEADSAGNSSESTPHISVSCS
jgi:hypothetical protein